ncbi:hypothetical protein RR42_m0349 [Cupriavidus basilensis]|uniref:Uncharacterized protein n=1 Tax=Cupriavidus basilensis TaxID=68895 RepID=A0A0C4Y4L5_9BURK|nr:hypothetical protein RR42_m0349 [Cupriavidus basilensis]
MAPFFIAGRRRATPGLRSPAVWIYSCQQLSPPMLASALARGIP